MLKNSLAPIVNRYSLGTITVRATNRNVLTPNLVAQLRDDEPERLDSLTVITFFRRGNVKAKKKVDLSDFTRYVAVGS